MIVLKTGASECHIKLNYTKFHCPTMCQSSNMDKRTPFNIKKTYVIQVIISFKRDTIHTRCGRVPRANLHVHIIDHALISAMFYKCRIYKKCVI